MTEIAGKSVFIAETSETMRSFKQNIIKELEHLGCDIKAPSDPAENISNYPEIIKRCDIAIHILSHEDEIIENEDIGIEEKQVKLSVQHYLNCGLPSSSPTAKFKIIAWHPKLNSQNIYEEENIPPHIQNIQHRDELELLLTTFEEFKNYLFKKINAVEEKSKKIEILHEEKNELTIYFIHDIKDINTAEKCIDFIKIMGFGVYTPIFSTNVLEVRQQHNHFLKTCDITIIFSSGTNANWANMKMMDILKSPGLGRENPILGNAIIMPSELQDKIPLLSRGFEFIKNNNNSITDQIAQFLKKYQ